MIGLILAAGNGSRFIESYNAKQCKALIKISNRVVLEYSLENLFHLHVDRILIVVGRYKPDIMEFVGDNYKNIPVDYVSQEIPYGLMNAFFKAVPYISDDVALQLSDEIFLGCRTREVRQLWKNGAADFFCGITYETDKNSIKNNYSVKTDAAMHLLHCVEKPDTVTNHLKGTGFCIFSRTCLSELQEIYNETANAPYDLCDFMNALTERGKTGRCVYVADKEININTVADFEYAQKTISEQEK
ncbi:MAG: NTP transferase domain-containing protein [Clostridia bacterium]|nr:NTP transferase domain-containing protein [Clostridia bacterium]